MNTNDNRKDGKQMNYKDKEKDSCLFALIRG